MNRYVLDTNHVSEMLKLPSQLNQRLAGMSNIELFLPMPVVAELWYMVKNSGRITENTARPSMWLNGFPRLEFSEPAAEEFGILKSAIRRSGRTVPDMDIQIASIASVNGMTVLTADAHFGFMPGIRVESWI
jgi:tRNA(fMet)-specific endonuclease VapC